MEGVRMPDEDEVQAVLDVLFLSKNINWEFEQAARHKSASKLDYTFKDKLMGRNPTRIYPGYTKHLCDQAFRNLINFALEQAERVRDGNNAIDIYPLTAVVVQIQKDAYGVELYLGRAGIHLVDGFKSYHEANWWAKYESEEYLVQKGLPKGAKLNMVGEKYW
jgi:hypothetical protein